MKKILSGLAATAVAGTLLAATAAPASAAWWHHHHHHGWYGPGAFAAGVIGFGIGAAIASDVGDDVRWSTHRARCDDRYRSYDWRSDTYLGRDGERHRCRL